jgi:sterol desaturase/sphingolipid hydroxylase (fatty acid hydroxylase superfamily)
MKINDEHYIEDLKWYVINEHVLRTFLLFCESSVLLYLSTINLQNKVNLAEENFFIQITLFVLLKQLVGYWLHRMMHTSDFLWQFHKVHHSATKLTATSNYRFSWFEELIGGAVSVGIIGLFQFSENIIAVVFIVLRTHCYFAHSNIRLNSKLLSRIFIMPRDHRWHHSKEKKFKYGQNFSGLLNIWDRVFGTYYKGDEDPQEMGLNDLVYPKSVLKRAIYPITKKSK